MLFWIVKKVILENKLRSMVPLMGIIIGVASIMGIFAISSGGELAVKRDLASIADNRVLIGSQDGFDIDDIKLVENTPIVKYVFSPDMNIIANYDVDTKVKVEGYTKSAINEKQLEIINNNNNQIRKKEVLIGNRLANKIFGNTDVSGRTFVLKVNNTQLELRVAGVYKEKLAGSLGVDSIYMDIDEFENISNSNVKNLVVTYNDNEGIEESTNYITNLLMRKSYNNKYFVLDGNAKYQKIEKIKKMINVFLGAVGLVALVMGGLGVSNLLMNFVREMTPSIGILRTMGVSSEDILKIFMLKSMILSVVGGVFGIIFGSVGAYVVGKVIGIPSVYYLNQVLMVFGTSVGMGIVFGSLPAWKASKLEIVEALRV